MAKVAGAGGRRRQWLPLFAVGILLGGAAVVGLSPDAQVPAPRPARASTSSSTSPVAASAAAVDRVELTVEQDAAREEQAAPAPGGPTLVVKARFRVRPAGAEAEGDFFRGVAVAVAADGGPATDADQEGRLRLSVAARRARFVAAGYRDIERDVPPPQAGCADFGDVVFEPDAAVRLRLSGAPATGTVRFALGRFPTAPYAQASVALTAGAAEVVLPAPSEDDLTVVAAAEPAGADSPWFGVEPQQVRLRSGQTATVELRLCPGVPVTVAMHGLSALLLPHLDLSICREDGNGRFPLDVDSPRCRLARDGKCRFLVPAGRCELMLLVEGRHQALRAVDGSGLVQTLAAGATLDVEPIEPLVGVVVRERGKAVPSGLSLRGPIGEPRQAPALDDCHVMLAGQLAAAPRLWFWSAGFGSRSCAQDDLQREADVAFVDAERGGGQARLTVLAEIPAEYYSALGVVAEPQGGGDALRIGNNRPPFTALLPSGALRLRWLCNGSPGAVIDENLTLAPGEHRELRATVPVLQPWTGRVADPAVLGRHGALMAVLVDGQWSLGGACADGTLPFVLPETPRADMPAELYLHMLKLRLPARITSIDFGGRTFVVEHGLTAADIAHVESRGLGSGERSVRLCSAIPDTRFAGDLGPGPEVPMLPGSERSGCLLEKIDGRRQVTCWFTLHHGVQQLLIEPRGHWATVRLLPQGIRARVLVEGFHGMDPLQVGELSHPGERRIFVADGTTAVHVDLEPGRRQSFAPELEELVVR